MYEHDSVINIDTIFHYYKFIEKIKKQFPDGEWEDCLSSGQIKSKLWLIDKLLDLKIDIGVVFILGGWYGTLAKFMLESTLNLNRICSFDIDDSCHEIAETINRSFVMDGWKFKATTFDIFNMKIPFKYETLRRDGSSVSLEDYPDTIINTSCEHMNNSWYDIIPYSTLCILQSNDFIEIEDHINCVEDIEDMKTKYPMEELMYEGKVNLDGYTRYMLIGYK